MQEQQEIKDSSKPLSEHSIYQVAQAMDAYGVPPIRQGRVMYILGATREQARHPAGTWSGKLCQKGWDLEWELCAARPTTEAEWRAGEIGSTNPSAPTPTDAPSLSPFAEIAAECARVTPDESYDRLCAQLSRAVIDIIQSGGVMPVLPADRFYLEGIHIRDAGRLAELYNNLAQSVRLAAFHLGSTRFMGGLHQIMTQAPAGVEGISWPRQTPTARNSTADMVDIANAVSAIMRKYKSAEV